MAPIPTTAPSQGAQDPALEEALHLSLERPEEAVRQLRMRLGLAGDGGGTHRQPAPAAAAAEAAAPLSSSSAVSMPMSVPGAPMQGEGGATTAAGAGAGSLSISMECIGATTPDAFPDFYRSLFDMEQQLMQQSPPPPPAPPLGLAAAAPGAAGRRQRRGQPPQQQQAQQQQQGRGAGGGGGGGEKGGSPSSRGPIPINPPTATPGTSPQSPKGWWFPSSSSSSTTTAVPPSSPPAVKLHFPHRGPPFPSLFQPPQGQGQNGAASPPLTALFAVSRSSSTGSTLSTASTSTTATTASSSAAASASSSSWPPTAQSLALVRALVSEVVHKSLFDATSTSASGSHNLTPRACRVNANDDDDEKGMGEQGMAAMGMDKGGAAGDAVLTALRAREAALLRELEQSSN